MTHQRAADQANEQIETSSPEEIEIPHRYEGFNKVDVSEGLKEKARDMTREVIQVNELSVGSTFSDGLAYGYAIRNKEIAKIVSDFLDIYQEDFANTGEEFSQGKAVALLNLLKVVESN